MKNKLSIGLLILSLCSLASCQEGLSSSSSSVGESSPNSVPSSSSIISSSNSGTSAPVYTYHPINESIKPDMFSNELSFTLNTNKISEEQAKDLVTNDLTQYPEDKTTKKRTSYTLKKSESHVTVNRSTATYSVKDLIEEKFTVNKTDEDNQWSYRRSEENTRTVYFKEDPLIRHIVTEHLYFIKDNCYYYVYANKSYYEGTEDKGTYESYYYKLDDFNIDDYAYTYYVPIDGYVYFSKTSNLTKIGKAVNNNFMTSTSFYTIDDYDAVQRDTNYQCYSSGEKGDFSCLASDSANYPFSNLRDYPSMEKNELDTISYHQDYLLDISNYFNYEENALMKSVSKNTKGETIRDETKESRKKVMEGCEIFYPDLSKFEEREYTSPGTRK